MNGIKKRRSFGSVFSDVLLMLLNKLTDVLYVVVEMHRVVFLREKGGDSGDVIGPGDLGTVLILGIEQMEGCLHRRASAWPCGSSGRSWW